MRDDEGSAIFHQSVECVLDDCLILGIDAGECFVEQENRCVLEQRPRDRQALALAT